MKKIWLIVLLTLLLSGCSKDISLETVTDVPDTPVIAAMQKALIQLPQELSTPVLEDKENGTLYLCDDYSLTVQTVQAGNLAKTIYNATGMDKDTLQIIKTQQGDAKRYQWVWSANGENGIQVGRGCVLDDGNYHYVLTALCDEETAGEIQSQWKEIFASFRLTPEREEISTGS